MFTMKKSATRKDDESDRSTNDAEPGDRGWVDLIKQVNGDHGTDVLSGGAKNKQRFW
jgi:hypothetical protein